MEETTSGRAVPGEPEGEELDLQLQLSLLRVMGDLGHPWVAGAALALPVWRRLGIDGNIMD